MRMRKSKQRVGERSRHGGLGWRRVLLACLFDVAVDVAEAKMTDGLGDVPRLSQAHQQTKKSKVNQALRVLWSIQKKGGRLTWKRSLIHALTAENICGIAPRRGTGWVDGVSQFQDTVTPHGKHG
ncbi:unnamed protein product [Prorocentrum cordatum]|uniref:Secreted protein n=1 Tax=Prorocentrum cordatum TaxID=2364126 RepID=A0ABN9WGD4_9DINO|nr:unnamed protein product [Polarella glacialis]